jgi:hypothetical protein
MATTSAAVGNSWPLAPRRRGTLLRTGWYLGGGGGSALRIPERQAAFFLAAPPHPRFHNGSRSIVSHRVTPARNRFVPGGILQDRRTWNRARRMQVQAVPPRRPDRRREREAQGDRQNQARIARGERRLHYHARPGLRRRAEPGGRTGAAITTRPGTCGSAPAGRSRRSPPTVRAGHDPRERRGERRVGPGAGR